jgi:hypothetical protein
MSRWSVFINNLDHYDCNDYDYHGDNDESRTVGGVQSMVRHKLKELGEEV